MTAKQRKKKQNSTAEKKDQEAKSKKKVWSKATKTCIVTSLTLLTMVAVFAVTDTSIIDILDTIQTRYSNNPFKDSKTVDNNKKEAPYPKASITNGADYDIRHILDDADRNLKEGNLKEAIMIYDNLLKKYPNSPRARYGKALALDNLAEKRKKNALLEESIEEFQKVVDLKDIPMELHILAARRLSDRQTFRGWGKKGAETLKRVTDKYPNRTDLWNALGVSYLMIGSSEAARNAFKRSLTISPKDGFAKVHLGFILKNTDLNFNDGIRLLREGINSKAEGTMDGRFYFHLGDALHRVGKSDEALSVYQRGADLGLFRSKYQRSLYNVNSLTGMPWWTTTQTQNEVHLKRLEDNWQTIRDEGLALLDEKKGVFLPEEENLREKGDWKQFTLYQQGKQFANNCKRAPKTCALLEQFKDATGCKRGQVKFSVMQPGVHVWPHCGPTNCRIRAHLGLVVPEGPRIRVANEQRTWTEGKFIIFDDSFEHEVWHEGKSVRLVLIVDMWHPQLTAEQKASLSPI